MEVREVFGFNAKEKIPSHSVPNVAVVFPGPSAQSAHWGAGTGALKDQAPLQPWGSAGKARGQLHSSSLADKCAPELPACVCGPCHNLMVNLPVVDYSFWCPQLYKWASVTMTLLWGRGDKCPWLMMWTLSSSRSPSTCDNFLFHGH